MYDDIIVRLTPTNTAIVVDATQIDCVKYTHGSAAESKMSSLCFSSSTVDQRDEARLEELRLERIESELYYSIDNDNPDRLAQLLSSTVDSPGGLGFVDPNTQFSGVDPLGKSLFWSPLHFCCEKGRHRCAEVLLAAGANRDVGDRWCMTPLMYAVQTEWFDMARMMIDAGATVDWQDTRGRTPLLLAVDCSDETLVYYDNYVQCMMIALRASIV